MAQGQLAGKVNYNEKLLKGAVELKRDFESVEVKKELEERFKAFAALREERRRGVEKREMGVKAIEQLVQERKILLLDPKSGFYRSMIKAAKEISPKAGSFRKVLFGENSSFLFYKNNRERWIAESKEKNDGKVEDLVLMEQRSDLAQKWAAVVEERVEEVLGKNGNEEDAKKLVEFIGEFFKENGDMLVSGEKEGILKIKFLDGVKWILGEELREKLFEELKADFLTYRQELILVDEFNAVMFENSSLDEDEFEKRLVLEMNKKLDQGSDKFQYGIGVVESGGCDQISREIELEYGKFAKLKEVSGGYKIEISPASSTKKIEIPVRIFENPRNGEVMIVIDDVNADGERSAKVAVSDKKAMTEEVRVRYVDYLMNQFFETLRVYAGPELNDFLKDVPMSKMAEIIFGMKFDKVDARMFDRGQISRFLRFLNILVNEDEGGSQFGSNLAMGNKIKVLILVFGRGGSWDLNSEVATKLRAVLNDMRSSKLKLTELLEKLGVKV